MDIEIGRGAEAVITESVFHGRRAAVKMRLPKGYRHPEIESRIGASRIRKEARVIRETRAAGVRTPVIYDIDMQKGSITMELLEGPKAKDVIDSAERPLEICEKIGVAVAKLHAAGICHGDLTTSNMIVCKDGSIGFIDFSMGDIGADTEALGVDMHLLERAFSSAHSSVKNGYDTILRSYKNSMPEARAVLERVEVIKGRARYT
ncbi:MAG: KEOPS complex kinase/ATPase Bud32 [Candidatus Methanomethylophilaceae archaeon]|nr:KEOPS complex kinase/ATPase Bud32 [Candidatus Methanomethylophilaceae archaeon]